MSGKYYFRQRNLILIRSKTELREKYLRRRQEFSLREVENSSKRIFENFRDRFPVEAGDKVHLFLSTAKFNEVQTGLFREYFREKGVRIFVPKIVDGAMISVEINDASEMKISKWGIEEPVSNLNAGITDYRYVITPLLYCDPAGNRVGYGKGYYDGFFSEIDSDCQKIGVSFFAPFEYISDIFPHDVALDYLVLTDKILSFRGLL